MTGLEKPKVVILDEVIEKFYKVAEELDSYKPVSSETKMYAEFEDSDQLELLFGNPQLIHGPIEYMTRAQCWEFGFPE